MIDLRSDTVTTPSAAMREASAEADVGDDVYGEDPTVNQLEDRTADVLGTEDALFCPSGTMANQIAIAVWTDPGEELLLEAQSHIYSYELGGAAWHSGLQTRPLDGGPRGAIPPEAIEDALAEESLHVAGTGLLALENTHNNRGGRALSVDAIRDAAEPAKEADVPVHLDGARLWNAAIAHDVDPAAYVAPVDSVMVSLSKGLGAPIGSMLAGSAEFIEQARRMRKGFGGGMRQVGVIAAPALLALERADELDRDHDLASRLAEGLAALSGVDVTHPETNIVVASLDDNLGPASAWLAAGKDHGVAGTDVGEYRIRYVTHRDVDADDIETALERLSTVHTERA